MAVASGLGSQVGVAAESTYGTYVTATTFVQALSVNLKKVKNTTQDTGLQAGRLLPLGSRRVTTTKGGEGSIKFNAVNKGMGVFLQALMGTAVTPVQQASTAAYLQTHTLADSFGKSLSIQSGVPDLSGTVRPYTFVGCRVTDATFTVEVDKDVECEFSIDAQDVSESQSLATASYATGTRQFVGTDATIKVGSFGSESSVTGVTKATVKIERPMKADRFYLGAAGLKAQPVANDFVKISGTITADYVDKTVWADRFRDDTAFSLVIELVGTQISGSYYNTLRIALPQCYLDGDTPVVEGADIVSGDFPFVATFDGTNLPKIEYISTDTSI
jgi:hypothetical protein